MAGAVRELGRAPMPQNPRLVVVPNHQFGLMAQDDGHIAADEVWCSRADLDTRVRGRRFVAWRYLDTLDRPPGPGADPARIEAWLQRDDSTPFPDLDPTTRFQLDAMVALG